MKRIAALMLLVFFTVAVAMPVPAQRISPEENARQSRKEIKRHQKMLNKANKKQRRAMKKSAKQQRKSIKKANRHYKNSFSR